MRFFHVTIHAQPSRAASWEQIFVESCSVPVLRLAADELTTAFTVTFDDVAKRLTELDRLFFEPDGSFVWVSNKGPTEWQLDGLLNDRGDFLMTVELKGTAPWPVLTTFLETIQWPQTDVVFQDMQRGLFYSTDAFRKLFAT